MADETDYIEETALNGVFIVKRPTFADQRGFFRETLRRSDLEKKLGYPFEVVQANHSRSQRGSLRGVHIAPWNKLVTVVHGEAQQVVVDLRPGSPTFGKHVSVVIGESNWASVFIPAFCGNAFLVLSDIADYTYLTTDYWAPGKETAVAYNDPDLAISWQIDDPIVSEKDQHNPSVREAFPNELT